MQKILISLALSTLLMACAHKPEIQQGNAVSQEQLGKLTIGMDRRQVRFIMGTPLIQDPFHQNRWDYYYNFTPSKGEATRYGATLFFEDDRLVRIEPYGPIPPSDR